MRRIIYLTQVYVNEHESQTSGCFELTGFSRPNPARKGPRIGRKRMNFQQKHRLARDGAGRMNLQTSFMELLKYSEQILQRELQDPCIT
jgi:hypothetical protein